jgi:hypothetical protein
MYGLPGCTIFFSRQRINEMIFRKKKLLIIKCVFFLYYLFSVTFHILSIVQRGAIISVHGYSSKVPVIFIRFS